MKVVLDLIVNNETIRTEMFRQRITSVKMAKIMRLSQTSFYKKANGKREFTASELGILAATLGKPVNFFTNDVSVLQTKA